MIRHSPLGETVFRYIIFRGKKFTKRNVDDAIDHLAKYLQANTKSTSPFILLTAYNHIKTIIAYHAILKIGKIAAILDPEWKSIEVSEIIEDIDPGTIIFINTVTLGFDYEEEIVLRKQNKSFIISSDLSEVCTLAYTNAEDGYSKGAMLTEKNILTEVDAIIKANKIIKKSITYSLLPFSHLYGFILGVLISTLSKGISIISEFNIIRIQEILEEISDFKVTHIYSVPSVYYIMSKFEGCDYLMRHVEMCVSGGNKLTPFIFERFLNKTNLKILEGYGLTETSPACTFNFPDEEINIESVGKPLAGSDIRIFNENGIECGKSQTGEICIKGDLIFKGYFNHQENTNLVIRNGWLQTGDYGKIDSNGFVYFCGLKKNMINVAGNKVYPKKLERMMKAYHNVIDVKIFSENSLLQGQIVSSKIKLKDSSINAQNEFKKWCFDNINNLILPKIWLFE